MNTTEANIAIRAALELWEEWWPYIDQIDVPVFQYHLRCIDAGLRYISSMRS